MSERAKRPCNRAGCSELVANGYCDAHRDAAKAHDRWRGSPASRGYDHEWSKLRRLALKRDKFLCQHCLLEGRVTPAQDVDHIRPISRAPHLRLVLSNLQALCRQHHAAKHAKETP